MCMSCVLVRLAGLSKWYLREFFDGQLGHFGDPVISGSDPVISGSDQTILEIFANSWVSHTTLHKDPFIHTQTQLLTIAEKLVNSLKHSYPKK